MERQGSTIGTVFRTGFLILIFEFGGTACTTIFLGMTGGVSFMFAYWFIVAI